MAVAARDLHAEAAVRLGRSLSEGELRVDLAAYDAALETAKEQLVAAIEKEKARAIRAITRGRGDPTLRITDDMLRILLRLRAAGRATAARELRAAGLRHIPATVELAEDAPPPPEIRDLWDTLRARLRWITFRIDQGAISAGYGTAARAAVERALTRRIPGARAAAADLVSPAFLSGLGDGFASLPVLPGVQWRYSAIGDAATCPPCQALDGGVYDTWALIETVLPGGGPNPLCHGGTRCRCRPVLETTAALRDAAPARA